MLSSSFHIIFFTLLQNKNKLFQRMCVELEQMASRPFAVVSIDIERKVDGYIAEKKEIPDYRKKKKVTLFS